MYDDQHDVRTMGLKTPVRNAYYYGQLLGVGNLELEAEYGIGHRRLLNCLALGWGVVCGLDVEAHDDGTKVRVLPGLGIDRAGRELVVPDPTPWTAVPQAVLDAAAAWGDDCGEHPCIQVYLCYHECRGDPQPVLAGDCECVDPCAPSTLSERYRIVFRPGCEKRREPKCRIPDLVNRRGIDYDQLAKWVTEDRDCVCAPRDTCILLANVPLADDDSEHTRCDPREVDTRVRRIVASNVVLWELILALLDRDRQERQYQEG
jgi:hypothetical protein